MPGGCHASRARQDRLGAYHLRCLAEEATEGLLSSVERLAVVGEGVKSIRKNRQELGQAKGHPPPLDSREVSACRDFYRMTRCPGWDATFLLSRLATVRDTHTGLPLRLGSGPFREAAMASSSLRTGLAIALAFGLLAVAPLDVLARGAGGRSSGFSSRLYSSGHTYRSPRKLSTRMRHSRSQFSVQQPALAPSRLRMRRKRSPHRVALARTSTSGTAGRGAVTSCSILMAHFHPALYFKLRRGECLTHIGTEG
jgi:hypothetical protein